MTREARMVGGGFVRDGEPLAQPTPPLSKDDVADLEQAAKRVSDGFSDGLDWSWMDDIRKLIEFYRANAPWN